MGTEMEARENGKEEGLYRSRKSVLRSYGSPALTKTIDLSSSQNKQLVTH